MGSVYYRRVRRSRFQAARALALKRSKFALP